MIHKIFYFVFPFYSRINLIAFEKLLKFEKWLLLNFYSEHNFLNFYSYFVHDIEFVSIYRETEQEFLDVYPIVIETQFKDFIDNEYRYDFSFLIEYRLFSYYPQTRAFLINFYKKNFKFEKFKFLNFVIFKILIEKSIMDYFLIINPNKTTSSDLFYYLFESLDEVKNSVNKKPLILVPDLLKFQNVKYFNKFDKITILNKLKNSVEYEREYEKLNNKRIVFFKKYFSFLNNFYKKLFSETNIFEPLIKEYRQLNLYLANRNEVIDVYPTLQENLEESYPIRFSETSVNKYLDAHSNTQKIFFLRKNRIFNKSRYSRNRQLYRTGVYWCLWFNILFVYGLFFFFYRFTFNFGYLWWGGCIFFFSFIIGKVLKYRFYNFKILLNEFYLFFTWIYNLFNLSYILSVFKSLGKLLK